MSVDGGASRARDGRSHHAGTVPRDERVALARGFGVVLRAEREAAGLTQDQLAARARLDRTTIGHLECGTRRPSTVSLWRVARALRPRRDYTLRDAVALDQRLRESVPVGSLRVHATRPHAAREAIRAELLAGRAGGQPATGADVMGTLILAALAAPSNQPKTG